MSGVPSLAWIHIGAIGEGGGRPQLAIVSPPCRVPRPGPIEVAAKRFGRTAKPVLLSVDGAYACPMVPTGGGWTARVTLDAGLHRIAARVGADRDIVDMLVRDMADIPRRGMPVAPGHDVHSIGAWPEHGIARTQLGANTIGSLW